ncbi:MAG: S8 family serine peptidase [Nocardioides sp.]
MIPSRRKKRQLGLAATIALSSALVTSLGSAAQADDGAPSPARSLAPAHVKLEGLRPPALQKTTPARRSYFVQLTGEGAATVARRADKAAVRSRRATIERQAGALAAQARRADGRAHDLFVVTNAVPGFGISTTAAGARALASQPDVVSVQPIMPRTVSNASVANLVGALQTWKFAGGTGEGVDIGIIDTGIDFTHSDFGGVGTAQAYADAEADTTDPTWHDTLPALAQAKIAGGFDFVGDDYDADPSSPNYQPIPNPDPNPIDCGQHGTHVAGTAAGYGVNSDGSTFAGDYASLAAGDLMDMKVGPGMAPKANLYALKVFGCEGSTDAVIPALDWALDPNGDADFSDHLDIVNLSLGSPYGMVDDPQNLVVDALAKNGVLPVISAGNEGDLTDVGGSPGNAVSSLQVASSVDAYQLRDGLVVEAPGDVAGTVAGQMSVAYDWPNNGPGGSPVTGSVVALSADNADGCAALSGADAAAVNGKVAWLVWDDNDETRACGSVARSANVKAAGAIGAVFTSGLDVFGAGITGDADIPVFQFPKTVTDQLQPAVDAGTLVVTFDGALQAQIQSVTPSITDTLSSFSSRGTHGSLGVVKPDVTAPGDTVASASMGTGSDPLVFSGTSMAAPATAGVAALVKGLHPTWTPLMLKAAVMNNAAHDLYTGPNRTGTRYAPARVGAGRIDARKATSSTVLAYVKHAKNAVSVSFGVVPAPITKKTVTKKRTLILSNTAKKAATVKLSYEGVNVTPGVTYSVSPATLTVPRRGTATATVTMKVKPGKLRHKIDKTMATQQLGLARQFVSDSSGRLLVKPTGSSALRVPVYGAPKPVSKSDGQRQPGQEALRDQRDRRQAGQERPGLRLGALRTRARPVQCQAAGLRRGHAARRLHQQHHREGPRPPVRRRGRGSAVPLVRHLDVRRLGQRRQRVDPLCRLRRGRRRGSGLRDLRPELPRHRPAPRHHGGLPHGGPVRPRAGQLHHR